jgi:hypothetical protein
LTFAALPMVALLVCTPAGRAMIAEILYDAAGDDTGREFVELFNPGSTTIGLSGVRLEAGDGAGPGRWKLQWAGGPADSLGPGGRFVIGGPLVEPPPDAVVTLELQNGPDAVRLVWPDGALEVVGYGALVDSEYFCAVPAPDAPAGSSLARLPDDSNRGSNALDFAPAEPTPGRANQVTLDAAIEPGSMSIDPPQPVPGATARLSATLINRGTRDLAAGQATLVATIGDAALATASAPALAPSESARVTCELPGLDAGKQVIALRVTLTGDERPEDDADSLRVRSGPGPLRITEIQFHPASGEGEWIEVRAGGGLPVELSQFTLSDRSAHPVALPVAAPSLEPDSLALLAERRGDLLARFPALDPARVIEVSPWAVLNNSDDSSGVADAVVLRERDGTPSDRVEYSARGIPSGVPLELGDAGWGPDSDPAGTPLGSPRSWASSAARFELGPRRLGAGERPRLAWSLPWPRARLAVEVFDLAGRRVARLAPFGVTAHGERNLDLLPGPGVYVLAISARSESSPDELRATRLVRLAGTAR